MPTRSHNCRPAAPLAARPTALEAAMPSAPSATLAAATAFAAPEKPAPGTPRRGPQRQAFTSGTCSDHQPCIEPPVASHSASPSDPSCDCNSEGRPQMPTRGHNCRSRSVQHQPVHVCVSCDHPSYTSRLVSQSCKANAPFSRPPAISASSSGKYWKTSQTQRHPQKATSLSSD